MRRVLTSAGLVAAGIIIGMAMSVVAQPTGTNTLPSVGVQGTVTPGNCVKWISSVVIADAGTTC